VLELLLRADDPRRGPLHLLLRYRGVRSLEPALPQLAALVEDVSLDVRASELLDARGTEREHRIQLGPAGSIVVGFAALEVSESLAFGGDYADGGPRFQVLSC
jgi:hypothetical protein